MSLLKFVHCSDIHLGRQRLGGKLPDSDFARAFAYIVNYTLDTGADALLIAGDLFDSPNIQPPFLQQATACLRPLQEAGIPVFAVEGNHDRATVTGESISWVRYLSDAGILHLLSIPFTPEGPVLTPWDLQSRQGSYYDFKGVRIVGSAYLGAGTIRRARLIAEEMARWDRKEVAAVIMLLHAGPDYIVQEGGGFSKENLEFLHERVDYLALGHIHKPMMHGGWAVNPGSPEHVRLEECRYDGQPRGMAVLEMDPALPEPLLKVEIRSLPRRKIYTLRYDCSPHGNKIKRAMEGIKEDIEAAVRSKDMEPEAALRLELTGAVNLGRIRLDTEALAQYLEEKIPLQAVEVHSGALQPTRAESSSHEGPEGPPSREALELAAIEELVANQPLPGLEGEAGELARFFYQLKEDVRNRASVQEIRERLECSPLVSRLLSQTEELVQPEAVVAAARDRREV